jgi:DNA polymerase-3 subunit delta
LIRVFYGKDEFSIYERIKEIRLAATSSELGDMNTAFLDGKDLSKQELITTASTVPFMSDNRLIIVDDLAKKFEFGRGAPKPKLGDWEGIESDLALIPETTELVFREGDLSSRNPMITALKNVAEVIFFQGLRHQEVIRWIIKRADYLNARIDRPAASLLAESIGGDLRILNAELEKLSLYKHGETIGRQDVSDFVPYVQEQSIFRVVDAAIEGDTGQSLKMAGLLIKAGSSPSMIIRMIERQVRLLLLARDMKARNVSNLDIGRKLSLSGYPLQKTLDMERKLTKKSFSFMHDLILDTELKIREGFLSEELALDLLIGRLGH